MQENKFYKNIRSSVWNQEETRGEGEKGETRGGEREERRRKEEREERRGGERRGGEEDEREEREEKEETKREEGEERAENNVAQFGVWVECWDQGLRLHDNTITKQKHDTQRRNNNRPTRRTFL